MCPRIVPGGGCEEGALTSPGPSLANPAIHTQRPGHRRGRGGRRAGDGLQGLEVSRGRGGLRYGANAPGGSRHRGIWASVSVLHGPHIRGAPAPSSRWAGTTPAPGTPEPLLQLRPHPASSFYSCPPKPPTGPGQRRLGKDNARPPSLLTAPRGGQRGPRTHSAGLSQGLSHRSCLNSGHAPPSARPRISSHLSDALPPLCPVWHHLLPEALLACCPAETLPGPLGAAPVMGGEGAGSVVGDMSQTGAGVTLLCTETATASHPPTLTGRRPAPRPPENGAAKALPREHWLSAGQGRWRAQRPSRGVGVWGEGPCGGAPGPICHCLSRCHRTLPGCMASRPTRPARLLAPFGVLPPPSFLHPLLMAGCCPSNRVAPVTQSCPRANTLGCPPARVRAGSRGPVRAS